MTKKKSSLGRGLASILGSTSTKTTKNKSTAEGKTPVAGATNEVFISQIETNPFQPRTEFSQEKLNELAVSIEQFGIIQPITVRKMGFDKYQLISGERRFRASQIAGLDKIPAFVRIANDQEMLEMALVENIQRENLNVVEEAKAYKNLIELNGIKNEELSKKIGKSSSHISNLIRLLDLDDKIHQMIIDGKISMGHARALIGVPNAVEKAKEIFEKKLSVRDVEKSTSKHKQTRKKKSEKE